MTQRPLGNEPTAAVPSSEPGPGRPDVGSTDFETTPEQPVIQHSGSPLLDADEAGVRYGDRPYPGGASAGTSSGSESTAQAAKGEAKQVAGTAADAGREVAATAKEGAQNVAAETKQQARSLLDTVRSEVGDQAGTQQHRIADALHGLSKELGGMASGSQESGPLTDLAQQASRKGGEVAHWLQEREPADVLEALRSYGRRHPVTFLALCGLAGVVAGRLTRSAVATRTSLDSHDDGDRALGTGSEVRSSSYATAPTFQPPASPAPPAGGLSTGVYAGSVETTEPAGYGRGADPAPYGSEPPIPSPGYVGTTDPLDPRGDQNR
jgi:hypothetical protein